MKVFSLIGNVCGMFSGLMIIYAAVTDGNIPEAVWPLWIAAVAAQICSYRRFTKKTK